MNPGTVLVRGLEWMVALADRGRARMVAAESARIRSIEHEASRRRRQHRPRQSAAALSCLPSPSTLT